MRLLLFIVLLLSAIVSLTGWRDPTMPVSNTGFSSSVQADNNASKIRLSVNAIIYSKHKAVAIVGDQMVKIGDKINQNEVVQITPTQVIVKNGEKTETLTLHSYSDNWIKRKQESK